MTKSNRHHYVPILFQRGFTDPLGQFVRYDKETREFKRGWVPRSVFYEFGLNAAFIHGYGEHHFEETIGALDNKWSKIIKELREKPIQEAVDALDPYNSAHLLHFAITMLWRHPKAGSKLLAEFDRLGVRSKYFGIERYISSLDQIPEEEATSGLRRFLKEPEWQKFAKFLVPFSRAIVEEIGIQGEWVKLYPVDIPDWNFLLGDRPVVVKQVKTGSPLLYECYLFPLSAKRLVVVAKDSANFLDASLSNLINVTIVHQADRYVCSPDENVLREAVKRYDGLRTKGIQEELNAVLFRQIQWRSTFKDYDAFLSAFQNKYGEPAET